jgi:hypothetical protein
VCSMPGDAGAMPASSINICWGVFKKFILITIMQQKGAIRPYWLYGLLNFLA